MKIFLPIIITLLVFLVSCSNVQSADTSDDNMPEISTSNSCQSSQPKSPDNKTSYEDTIYPATAIVRKSETDVTLRFDFPNANETGIIYYWKSNIVVPAEWENNVSASGDNEVRPLIEISSFNLHNGKTIEEIFDVLFKANEERKKWGDIYEDLSLITVDGKNFVRIVNSAFPIRYDPNNIVCIGGPHYCIYFGTFKDEGELYAWQAAFYLPEVDPETCVTKEVLEEQEKILSTFEVVGKVK